MARRAHIEVGFCQRARDGKREHHVAIKFARRGRHVGDRKRVPLRGARGGRRRHKEEHHGKRGRNPRGNVGDSMLHARAAASLVE